MKYGGIYYDIDNIRNIETFLIPLNRNYTLFILKDDVDYMFGTDGSCTNIRINKYIAQKYWKFSEYNILTALTSDHFEHGYLGNLEDTIFQLLCEAIGKLNL